MPHPKAGYPPTKDGRSCPGVTTITGRFKESGGMIHAAWKLGMEGLDYKEIWGHAADIGTAAHAMVEAFIRKTTFDSIPFASEVISRASVSFGAFKEWAKADCLQVTDTETSMISETYAYGGTIDGCYVGEKRVIWDVKTGKLYPEHVVQIAAYRQLWNENHSDDLCEPGGHLCCFDKENGDFHHHFFSDLDDAWNAFVHMRALYDLMGRLKRRVK
jgi:hypothetical protein